MIFQTFKRLVIEDFPQQYQDIIGRVATVLNPMVDQLNIGFNHNIDFLNLNQQRVNVAVTVDASGIPQGVSGVVSHLKTTIVGVEVVNSVNANGVFPNAAVQIFFTSTSTGITMNKIVGLPAGIPFILTVILQG